VIIISIAKVFLPNLLKEGICQTFCCSSFYTVSTSLVQNFVLKQLNWERGELRFLGDLVVHALHTQNFFFKINCLEFEFGGSFSTKF